MSVIVKLGGSVITDKSSPNTIDEASLEAACRSLAATPDADLVLIHGGGSFGHPAAAEHGLSESTGSNAAPGVVETHAAVARLNARVVERLHDHGVNAVPVHPFSFAFRSPVGVECGTDHISAMVAESFVPVLHGDTITQQDCGATILSGDILLVQLAESMGVDRVGVCVDVPGVLDEAGRVVERVDGLDDVRGLVAGSQATDVTGGMAGKIEALLELETSASLFGLEALDEFLDGGQPGTTISPE